MDKQRLLACLGTGLMGLALLNPAPALANDTSVTFIGGVPRLVQENQISMKSEKLEFRYVQPPARPKAASKPFCPSGWYEDQGQCHTQPYWQADLLYTFANQGPARTLTIGLPFDMPDCLDESDINGPSLCDKEGMRNLSTEIDGRLAPVSRTDVKVSKPVHFNRLYSVQVPFAAGQTRTLRHRYQSYTISSVEGLRFLYLLRTGSTWAGPIGKAEIAFELPPGHGPCVTANLPYSYDGHWLKIALNNWKPDRDLDIVFADRIRSLIGTGVFAYVDELGEVCGDALKQPPGARHLLADQIELLYGAPATGKAGALKLGPLPLCSSSGYFTMIAQKDDDFMPHVGLAGLRFLPDPAFPANMPPLLRQCVAELRK